jgi:peptidoglycan hydrolase CwlO-like protein
VFALIAAALLAILGVYASIPVTERRANAPPVNETAQAIRDLQASQQRAADQLKALQQTVSSDQAEIIRLSEKVTALTGKLEALQQSFASAQRAPALLQPLEPAKQKRVAR